MKRRTSVIIDDDLLTEAASVLGTKTVSQTVRKALEQAIRQVHLEQLAAWELPADFPDELTRMRAPRAPTTE